MENDVNPIENLTEKPKSKLWIWILGTIIIVIIVIIAVFFLVFFPQKYSIPSIPECEGIESETWKIDCYISYASQTQDTSICDKLNEKSSAYSDYCYSKVALSMKDPSLCEKIQNKSVVGFYEDSVIDPCYTDIAVKLKDANICEKAIGENNKDACFNSIAIDLMDVSICDRIMDKANGEDFYSNQCYTIIERKQAP